MKTQFSDDPLVVQRVLDHIDQRTTDMSESNWREPVENYRSPERLAAELRMLRSYPTPFCPSAALPEPGSFVAREAAGTPLLAVRGAGGEVNVFRNACRHRGAQIATGSGCAKVLVCPYHAWAYGLDGQLRHVPYEHGFPELDKSTRGLVPVRADERHGIVFVTQEPSAFDASALDGLPELIPSDEWIYSIVEDDVMANWKLIAEGFLEGYHIRPTHRETFLPHGFDNLTVVETAGRNRRVTFPFKAIEKMRAVPGAQRVADRVLTYAYHLFPNVMLVTFPDLIALIVLEPAAPDRTRVFSYSMGARGGRNSETSDAAKLAKEFLDAGIAEDRAIHCGQQKNLASGSNEFFEFGRFEGALAHFHRTLDAALDICGHEQRRAARRCPDIEAPNER